MGISKLIYNIYSLITFKDTKTKCIEVKCIEENKCTIKQPLNTLVFYEPSYFKQNIEQVYNKQSVFLVVNKSTQMPLGIYHNCLIYNYSINDKCTFVKNPIFEDK